MRISFAYTTTESAWRGGAYLVREGTNFRLRERLALKENSDLLIGDIDILLIGLRHF
jgi:hypothetical protein